MFSAQSSAFVSPLHISVKRTTVDDFVVVEPSKIKAQKRGSAIWTASKPTRNLISFATSASMKSIAYAAQMGKIHGNLDSK